MAFKTVRIQGTGISFDIVSKDYGIGSIIKYNDKEYQVIAEDAITIIVK